MISRKTTKEERIKIVQYCIAHGSNYHKTAELFDVSIENVYNWVKNFSVNGVDGLENDNGDDGIDKEQLRHETEYMENELEEAQLEKRLLLKVQEIEERKSQEKIPQKSNNRRKKERHKKKKH